jgi:hypothetical protein
MRIPSLLAAIACVATLTACYSNGGYYDANSNWVAPATQQGRSSASGTTAEYHFENSYPHRVVQYDRPGIYDTHGNWVAVADTIRIPRDMFPARGMCRVWHPRRDPAQQPAPVKCREARQQVPSGALVIYGG